MEERRLYDCRHYDACLTYHAKADIRQINCRHCRRYTPHKLPQEQAYADFECCIDLWTEVFSWPRVLEQFLAPDESVFT